VHLALCALVVAHPAQSRQARDRFGLPRLDQPSPGYEPLSGSGTTLIAAEMAGRACHAVELAPAYVHVAVAR